MWDVCTKLETIILLISLVTLTWQLLHRVRKNTMHPDIKILSSYKPQQGVEAVTCLFHYFVFTIIVKILLISMFSAVILII